MLAALTVVGLADRSILLCRFPAAEAGRAPHPHRRTGACAGDADRIRNRTAACRNARRSRGRARRTRGGRVPRAHQASRGGAARPRSQRLRTRARSTKHAANSCWSSRRPWPPTQPSEDDADALLRAALARTSLKDAVGEVADATGLPRRTLYQRALALAEGKAGRASDGTPRRAASTAAARPRPSASPPSGSAFRRKAAPPCS